MAVLISIGIGSYPLLDADEGRNAAVARDMATSNDYVVPRLNGLPYLDKPIVYFASAAAMMEIFGPTEFAARLPALLFTFATALLVFWFVSRVARRELAYIATIAYLAAPMTIVFSRTVIFDSALSFFVTAATIAFYFAIEQEQAPRWSARTWRVIAWGSIGFGILTKGPVALLLPLLVAVPYAVWRRRGRAPWSLAGAATMILVITPWLWAMQQAVGDFLQYAILTETVARVATNELKRTGPPWYFIPYLIGGALPWVLTTVAGGSWKNLRGHSGERSPLLFTALWVIAPLIFFSISQSKRPQYILPLMVPVAILLAMQWDSPKWSRGARATGALLLFLGIVFLVGPALPPWAKLKPELEPSARVVARLLGGALALGGAVAIAARRRELSFAALALAAASMPLTCAPLMETIAQGRSAKSLVAELRGVVDRNTEVVAIEAFTGSMSFYLGRPITVFSRDGSEYTSNYVLRRYDRFAGKEHSTLQPLSALAGSVNRCCAPRIFIVRDDDPHHEKALQQLGLRFLGASAHFHAYGPWWGKRTMP